VCSLSTLKSELCTWYLPLDTYHPEEMAGEINNVVLETPNHLNFKLKPGLTKFYQNSATYMIIAVAVGFNRSMKNSHS